MRGPDHTASVRGWYVRLALHGARAPLGLALAVALASCAGGQTGSEYAPAVAPPPGCSTHDQCAARIEAALAALRQPRGAAARRLVSAQCVETPDCDNLSATSCMCTSVPEGGGATQRFFLGGPKCALYGRGLDCLMPADELPSCQAGCECVQACTRALELRAADDARELAVQLRAARCVSGECRSSIQLPVGCVSGHGLSPTSALDSTLEPLSCSLPDDELLLPPSVAPPGRRFCVAGGSVPLDELQQAGAGACQPTTRSTP